MIKEKDITLFRIFRGGILVDKEEFDKNYSITYSSLYKKDFSPYVGLALEYTGDKLSFKDSYNGDAVVENDTLTVTITDNRSGKTSSIDLITDSCFKIDNSPETYSSFTGEDSQQVTYNVRKTISKVSIPDSNISGSISYDKNKNTILTLTISKLPEKESVILYDADGNSESLRLNSTEEHL